MARAQQRWEGQPHQGQPPRELLDALTSTQEQYRLGNLSEGDFLPLTRSILDAMKASNPNRRPFRLPPQPTHPALLPPGVPQPSWSDINGAGPFPVNGGSVGAFQLFADDEGHPVHKYQAAAAWAALPEDEKGVYRARAEAIRREAWAEYETRLACKDAGLPQPPYPKPAGAPPPHIQAALDRHPGMVWPNPNPVLPLSGFEVFRNDLVAEDPVPGRAGEVGGADGPAAGAIRGPGLGGE
jgi:hypothetical protein